MAKGESKRVKCDIPKCPAYTNNPKRIVLVGHPTDPPKELQICEECALRLAHVQAMRKGSAKLQ